MINEPVRDPRYPAGAAVTTTADLSSGVSWGAIFAGAAAAASLSLVLLILGVGLGLSSVSPWSGAGASAGAIGISAIAWLTFTQLAASGMGGYLAGRLRTRWASINNDEVYFRDTAHGFLAWGVATLVTVALLSSTIGSILGTSAQVGASAVSGVATAGAGAATAAAASGGMSGAVSGGQGMASYAVDTLFRQGTGSSASSAPAAPDAANNATTSNTSSAPAGSMSAPSSMGASQAPVPVAEVGRIFASAMQSGEAIPAEDTRYVGQLIAARTGISQQDAEKRVTDAYAKVQAKAAEAETKAREAADKARKATAYTSIWMVISLLIGAFVASLAATYGGRRRDF